MSMLGTRRHGQVCLINPNFLGAVLPRTAISAKNSWSPGTIAYDRGVGVWLGTLLSTFGFDVTVANIILKYLGIQM